MPGGAIGTMDDSLFLPRPQSLPSLTEQTYEIIQTAVLSLELKPGERLSVQRLSEQLGVSRTPVKDALLRLEQDSLVSIVPQRGTFVSDITAEDVEEILELRGCSCWLPKGRRKGYHLWLRW
jgi:DNA-binding GntR family transcriptional regulator